MSTAVAPTAARRVWAATASTGWSSRSPPPSRWAPTWTPSTTCRSVTAPTTATGWPTSPRTTAPTGSASTPCPRWSPGGCCSTSRRSAARRSVPATSSPSTTPAPRSAAARFAPATGCCSTPAGAGAGASTTTGTPPASRARAWTWPDGWPSTGWRSPAATPGATVRCRPRTRTSPSSSHRRSTSGTASSCWRTCGSPRPPPTGCASSASSSATPSSAAPPAPGSRRSPSPDSPSPDSPSPDSGVAMPEHADVIVIGSGAGGGAVAWALAPTGKKILLLERGDWLHREPENWSPQALWADKRYANSGQWTDGADGRRFTPKQHYYVGGNTKFYGAILYRFRERDFGPVQHVDGISPAWPISYADLQPWYDRAEQLYQVHGTRGEDPDDPPAAS